MLLFKAYLVTNLKALVVAWTLHFSTSHNLHASECTGRRDQNKEPSGCVNEYDSFCKSLLIPTLLCYIKKR